MVLKNDKKSFVSILANSDVIIANDADMCKISSD